MKKFITLSLLIALFLSTFASCGGGEGTASTTDTTAGNGDTTETIAETEPELTDALPVDLQFDGADVGFLTGTYNELYCPIFMHEQTGDVLNDARFQTKMYLEDRLNVVVTEDYIEGAPDNMNNTTKNMIAAGEDTYDILTNMDRFIIATTLENMYYAASDLPYMDLEAEYWNPKTTSRFLVGEKVFFTLSSFNLYSYARAATVMVNMDLATDLQIPDLYTTVMDGKWTYDLMDSYAAQAYVDTNGDGAVNEGDQFGTSIHTNKNSWITAVVGANCYDEVMHKDQNNFFVYDISEKMVDVLEMIYVMNNQSYVTIGGLDKVISLFHETVLASMTSYRELEYELLLLPVPKYEETQKDYSCRTYDSYFTMVPVTCGNLELAGAVLECLACEAYKNLLPAYIDVTLQQKLSHNAETAEMIELILNSRTISIAEAFLFSTWGNDPVYQNYINGNNESPASYIASKESAVQKEIEKYNNFFSAVQ